jgi:type 1 glutamine amidotransferase
MGGISRRKLLQSAGAAALAGTLGSSGSSALGQSASTKPRVIVLMGDRYHNQNDIRIALNRVFEELGISVDYTTNYYDLSAALLKPYQLFVCLRDNMIWPGGYEQDSGATRNISSLENPGEFPPAKAEYWITEEQGSAVKDFVAAGNGFYSMHNNAFLSRTSKNFREVQGGFAYSHPPLRPFQVRIVNKNHPVTEGVEDFMVTDEQHYLRYDKDPKNVLLESVNLDSLTFTPSLRDPLDPDQGPPVSLGTTTVSGWAHEYGKGRVVFTAMGHTTDAMWQPDHLKLQKNAVRWLLKMT